jgi:hypothetical protein
MFRQRTVSALLAAFVAAACHDSTSPHAGPPAHIDAVTATGISATVGSSISSPLGVRVTDAKGIPVPNVTVVFSAPDGNILTPPSAPTDADGHAETHIRLGLSAGSFQVNASVTGVVTTAAFTVSATPGPLARVALNTHVATVPTALDTVRLTAAGADQYGNSIGGTIITWTSRDPTMLTVDGTGLVRALQRGGPVYIVATAGTIADSVAVSAPPSPCGSAQVTTLNVAQVLTDVSAAGFCLRGGTTPSEYALIPFSGATTAASQVSVEIAAHGIGTPPALSITSPFAVNRDVMQGPIGTELRSSRSLDWSFDWRLRSQTRKLLGPRIALARQRFGARAMSRIAMPRASLATQVGDFVTLNTNANDACENPMPSAARVAAISDKAIILTDTTSPAGGYTDAEFQSFATTFDTLVYPVDVQAFGEPSDLDGNGRVLIFFTPAVNRLTPPGSQGFVEGFFYERDLFPIAQCAGSNQAEMFYMVVPDPNGVVNGNVIRKQDVSAFAVDVLAHEFQHLINGARRVYVNDATDFEEEWLNEGLSEIAEELMFFHTSGRQPRQNIGDGFLQSQREVDAYNQYFLNDFSLYISYLFSTASSSPFEPDDLSAEMRGAIWNMLRYSADRARSTDGDFWYQLVNSTTTGRTNLANVLGVTDDGLTSYFRDWSVSVFADDALPGVDVRFTQPSWNVRKMLATWFSQSFAFPIETLPLTDGVLASVMLDGGGSVPARFTVPAYQDVFIVVTSNGAAPPPEVMLSLLRTR